MKIIVKPGILFLVLNILISLPIYNFHSKEMGLISLFCVLYFSLVWILVEFFTIKALKLEIDLVSIGLGLRIGLKFLLSMFFVGVMIWSQIFVDISSVFLFLMYYFVYTFAMLLIKAK